MTLPATADLSRMDGGSAVFNRWAHATLDSGLPFATEGSWRTNTPGEDAIAVLTTAEAGGQLKARWKDRHGCGASQIDGKGWSAYFHSWEGGWGLSIAGTDFAKIDKLLAGVEAMAGPPPTYNSGRVPLTVWTYNPMTGGGRTRYTSAAVGDWANVEANYPGEVRASMAQLAAGLPDPDKGGLVVLGGQAGTGKTRGIEGLISKWSQDAEVSVVVDPDKLLDNSTYLVDVLSYESEKRHVVIVEDADDLLAAGDKTPAAARVLNVADGILGRCGGMSGVLLVFTANLMLTQKAAQEIGHDRWIADYMTRPGRAAAAIEFRAFTADEATSWAVGRNLERTFTEGRTLAELYAGR